MDNTLSQNSLISSPTSQIPEQKKKKKKLIFIIFSIFLSVAVVATGVVLGVVLGAKKTATPNTLSVSIDPIIVNNSNQTHVDGAESFTLDLTNNASTFTKDLSVNLTGEEYFKYAIEIKSNSTEKINFSVSLSDIENEGFAITYILGETELAFPTESVISGEILMGQTEKIEIIFRISNAQVDSARIAGKLTFMASIIEV